MSTWNENDLKVKGYWQQPDGSWGKTPPPIPPEAEAELKRLDHERWFGKEKSPAEIIRQATSTGIFEFRAMPVELWQICIQGKTAYSFDIVPMGKPRMVRSDKYKKRPRVERYWAYKASLQTIATNLHYQMGNVLIVEFLMPMPKKWGQEERMKMLFTPHMQKPDSDNIVKGLQDAMMKNDESIYELHVRKIWSLEPKIIIYA